MSKHSADERDWRVPVPGTWARAAKITVPVLAVNGDLDSPDHIAMAERLVGAAAHGRAATVGGTAHYPNMERPDAYNEILMEFLRTLQD